MIFKWARLIILILISGEDEVEKMLREMRTEPNWNQLGSLGSNLQAKLESGGSGPFQSGQDALDHLKNTRRDSKTSPNTTSNERSPFKESNGGGDGGDRFRKAFSPRNSSGTALSLMVLILFYLEECRRAHLALLTLKWKLQSNERSKLLQKLPNAKIFGQKFRLILSYSF